MSSAGTPMAPPPARPHQWWLARRAARIMNSYLLPGIPPLTWRQWLLILMLSGLLFLTLFGGVGLLAAPPRLGV